MLILVCVLWFIPAPEPMGHLIEGLCHSRYAVREACAAAIRDRLRSPQCVTWEPVIARRVYRKFCIDWWVMRASLIHPSVEVRSRCEEFFAHHDECDQCRGRQHCPEWKRPADSEYSIACAVCGLCHQGVGKGRPCKICRGFGYVLR